MGITQAQTTKPPPTPNMIAIFLALLSLTAAHPDPATLFETIPILDKGPEGLNAPGNIQDVLKDQGILLAEETFDSTLAKSSCLARNSASLELRKRQDTACSDSKLDRSPLE